MGRRKWKQYQDSQDSLAQSHATDLLDKQSPSIGEFCPRLARKLCFYCSTRSAEQQETGNKLQAEDEINRTTVKAEAEEIKEETKLMTVEGKSGTWIRYGQLPTVFDALVRLESDPEKDAKTHVCVKSEPVDWKPQEKCYFCVDGKLLKVNESGELVPETTPENDLSKHVRKLLGLFEVFCDFSLAPQIIESDDSSSSSETTPKRNHKAFQPPLSSHLSQKNLEAFLKTFGANPNMTSLESMAAAQIAAFQRLQPEMNPFFNPSECRVAKANEI